MLSISRKNRIALMFVKSQKLPTYPIRLIAPEDMAASWMQDLLCYKFIYCAT